MTDTGRQTPQRWTIHVCKDCRELAHCGDRCKRDRRRVWTEMELVKVVEASLLDDATRALEEARFTLRDVARTRRSDAWGVAVNAANATLPIVDECLARLRQEASE